MVLNVIASPRLSWGASWPGGNRSTAFITGRSMLLERRQSFAEVRRTRRQLQSRGLALHGFAEAARDCAIDAVLGQADGDGGPAGQVGDEVRGERIQLGIGH